MQTDKVRYVPKNLLLRPDQTEKLRRLKFKTKVSESELARRALDRMFQEHSAK